MAVYQNLSVTQLSQDTEHNCSRIRIRWTSTQTGSSYNMVEGKGWYALSVNGQESIREVTYVLPRQTEQTIVETEETVFHDSNGQAEILVQTWMDTHISAGVVELSQVLQLTPIPRSSTVLASDAIIGGHSQLTVLRKNSTYTHSIFWQFGSLSGYLTPEGESSETPVYFSGESLLFPIPDSFYQEIPCAKSGICTLTVETFHGDTPIGTPRTEVFTVSVDEAQCAPLLYTSLKDINPATLALTRDERVLVQHCSVAECGIIAYPRKGAHIVSRRIQGIEPEGEYVRLSHIQSREIRYEVTDSRGITVWATEPVEMIPYVPLTCIAQAQRLDPVSGRAVLTLSGDYFAGSFSLYDNELTAHYSLDGVNYIPLQPEITGENRYRLEQALTDMDYTRVYHITVRVSDKLSQATAQAILKKGVPVFDWGEGDFAFHVPVRMDAPLGVAYGGTGASDAPTAWENLELSIPLETGTEYILPEKWNNFPVYTRLVDFGSMPNQAVLGVSHPVRGGKMLRCTGTTSDGRCLPWGGVHGDRIDVFCDGNRVYIDAAADESAHTALVQIFYTKQRE